MRYLVIAVLLAASTARAESSRTLSLDDVLSLASKNNRDLKVARVRLEQAALNVDQAWTALYPQALAQGRYTHNYKEVAIDPSRFGGAPAAMPLAPIVIQKQEQLDATGTISVPLLVPSAYPGVAAARASERSSQATFAVTETSVLLAAAQSFYQSAVADEVLRARQSAIEVARVSWKNAKTRFSAGEVTTVDVARAELALVRAEQAARDAAYARSQAYRGLGTIVQADGAFTVQPGEVAAVAVDGDVETALRLRPERVALDASLEASAAQERSSGWRWAPTLSAFGTARVSNYAGFSGDDFFWAAGASLDWVLFDGGVRDVQRRSARAQQRELGERLLQLKDSVRDELANSRQLVDTKRAAVDSARRAQDLARATLDLVRVQYESGATTQLALLEAQDALVAADVSLAQAKFELALADLSARRAAGTFPPRR
jgi:outer membrane protein TolC